MSERHFHPLIFRTNACFDEQLHWTDEDGVAYDLTTATARMQVRNAATGALVLELTTANGRIVLGSADPNIKLHIEETDLAALAAQKVKWDLLIAYADGHTEAFPLEGPGEVVAGVTT